MSVGKVSQSPTNPRKVEHKHSFDVADLYRGPAGEVAAPSATGGRDLAEKLRQAYFWIVNSAIISPFYDIEYQDGPSPSFTLGDAGVKVRLPSGQSYSSFCLLPLLNLVKVNPLWKIIRKAMGAKVRPPFVYFIWGMFSLVPLMTFKAVVQDLSVVFTYFSPEGVPLRASVTVVFQAVLNEFLGQNPTSRSEARKMRVVAEGETLDYIAYQEYGDSARWRHIALVNDIDNPMSVRAGTVLKLTPIDGASAR